MWSNIFVTKSRSESPGSVLQVHMCESRHVKCTPVDSLTYRYSLSLTRTHVYVLPSQAITRITRSHTHPVQHGEAEVHSHCDPDRAVFEREVSADRLVVWNEAEAPALVPVREVARVHISTQVRRDCRWHDKREHLSNGMKVGVPWTKQGVWTCKRR